MPSLFHDLEIAVCPDDDVLQVTILAPVDMFPQAPRVEVSWGELAVIQISEAALRTMLDSTAFDALDDHECAELLGG